MATGRVENLRSFGELTTEERREIAIRAGKASGEARRRHKSMREAAKYLLQAALTLPNVDAEELKEMGVEDPTNADGLLYIAIRKAARGDVEAMRFVRDTGGEVPTAKVEVGGIEDKPLQVLDLSSLSDAQLQELAASRMDKDA